MNNILELLERNSILYSDQKAFTDPYGSVTFSALLLQAKQVGTYFLTMDAPLHAEEAVAFYMAKSVDALSVMFGALYCGAFYSFVDVRQPAERAGMALSCLEPGVIVTDRENEEALRALAPEYAPNAKILLIEDFMEEIRVLPVSEALLKQAREKFYDRMPLYVNFTSGSTGTPKGVVVGHASVLEFISEFTRIFDITDRDIMANQAPFDFDVSVKDIYSGLMVGAEVVLIPREYFSNPTILMDYLCEHQVTTLVWAVSAMCFVSIMNGLAYKTPENVNKVIFSGEVMPVKQLNKWREYLPNAMYVNVYGPTEITCNCTYEIIDREYAKDEVIPIGIPFPNEKVFLLDEKDELITDTDIEGEICVGGSCLALGYYKDSQKTAEVFVQNPLNKRFIETIYRTGDLGRYDESGKLIYTSRKDFQIKHMGQRIELGEIEAAAMAVDGVSRACCTYDQKHKKINLYYTGEIEREELSERLHEKLPPYMAPNKTSRLDEFPLNKNGKIDRKALDA